MATSKPYSVTVRVTIYLKNAMAEGSTEAVLRGVEQLAIGVTDDSLNAKAIADAAAWDDFSDAVFKLRHTLRENALIPKKARG